MNDRPTGVGADLSSNWDERAVDLLVDGELGDAERRELLDRLERTPDGWRRCALAFLEGQAWRQVMRDGGDAAAVPASTRAADVASSSRKTGRRSWTPAAWSVPALAAAVLAAFALGWVAHAAAGRGLPFVIATNSPRATPATAAHTESGATPAEAAPQAAEPITDVDPAGALRLVGILTLTVDRNGTEEPVSVPIVDGSTIDPEWLLSQPVAVPQAILREVERQGHKLVANRQLVPIELGDGQRAVMPIDRVEVRVAGRVYQ